jgi:hypothetical protein
MIAKSVLRGYHISFAPIWADIISCNNQVGKVEEGHIDRNVVLRSTTTWPNERVSLALAVSGTRLIIADNNVFSVHLNFASLYHL